MPKNHIDHSGVDPAPGLGAFNTMFLSTITLQGQTLAPARRTVRSVTSSGGTTDTETTYQAGDGMISARSSFGRESVSVRTLANSVGAWTTTTIRPDGTQTHTAITKGGLEQTTSFRNTAGTTVISSTATVRNALGRLLSSTDSRTGATTYSAHTPAGQALTTTLPGSRATSLTVDGMGRTLSVNAPDTAIAFGTSLNVTYSSYYPTGQLKAQWGDQTNAAFYLYDEQNRVTELRTYRSLASGTEPVLATTGSDATTWLYDADRGWLTGKRDAANLGANYTYTAAGRLRTRQWARGNWTRYDYHPASGVQTATRYFTAANIYADVIHQPSTPTGDDPETPDCAYTFDHLGRLDTASTFPGSAPTTILTSNQYVYTGNFTVDKEVITVDPDGSGSIPALTRTLERNEDSLRRSEGWDLKNGGTTEHGNAYTYHATAGRLDTVTGSSSTFTYGYTANSAHLLATVTGPTLTGGVFTVTNTWLSDRDALDLKENKVGTTNISTYDYNVNGISQRDNVSTSGTAFGTAMDTTDWSYDRLGQVVNADHPTPSKNFAFAYDQMGNRQKSARNTSLIDTPFTANQGRYYEGATTSTALGGNALNQYGLLSLYGTATNLVNTYDADGNQLEGRFPTTPSTSTAGGNVRTWDGENRLISATVHGGTAMLYAYDAFHRRVIKGTGSSDVTMTLYDGWNPIADYRHTSSTALESTYTWGQDLSGSLQGAGGVGGLLAVQRHSPVASPGTYYPTYDGNGNVSEYLNTIGTIVAHYEYGPFGEALTVATLSPPATLSGLFKHRFSTKPLDDETGYYYYGYRSYDPLSGRWLNRDPIEEEGGMNLYGMIGNDIVGGIDVLGMGPCEDKFKGRLREAVNKIGRNKKTANNHQKEINKRKGEFRDDLGEEVIQPDGSLKRIPLKHNGKTTPPYPPSETRNGHADIVDFHKAHKAAAEAAAQAAIDEFNSIMAEYWACRAAQQGAGKIAGKCCKAVIKKVGVVVFFALDCSTEGVQAAADNALWPLSEAWSDSADSLPTLDDVDDTDEEGLPLPPFGPGARPIPGGLMPMAD